MLRIEVGTNNTKLGLTILQPVHVSSWELERTHRGIIFGSGIHSEDVFFFSVRSGLCHLKGVFA